MILGPSFGGNAVSFLGFSGVIIFNGLTYIISGLSEMFITYNAKPLVKKQENLGLIKKYRLGWSLLTGKEEIKYYIILAGIRALIVGLVNISFIFVADKVFIKGTESVGYIYSALGCGLVTGSLLIGRWKYKMSSMKLYLSYT